MEATLLRVVEQETEDLTREVECQAGIHDADARRFVQVASAELVASYEWQKEHLNHLDLTDPRNVRSILGAVCASRIARDLELSLTQVWCGLRALVPRVLELAAGFRRVASPTWPWKSDALSWPARRAPLARAEFLHPVE